MESNAPDKTTDNNSAATPAPKSTNKYMPSKTFVVAAIGIIAVLAIVFAVVIPRVKYSQAQAAFDEGNYALAQQLFSDTNYKDASDRAQLCQGMTSLKKGNYKDAIDTIEPIVDKIPESAKRYKEACYLYANELYDGEDYEKAVGYYKKPIRTKTQRTAWKKRKRLPVSKKSQTTGTILLTRHTTRWTSPWILSGKAFPTLNAITGTT